MKTRKAQTFIGNGVNGGSGVFGAVATKISKADVVEKHNQNVGLARRDMRLLSDAMVGPMRF
jgi:hypothetical protein